MSSGFPTGHPTHIPTASALIFGAPFADWSDLLVEEPGGLVGGVVSSAWMGEPYWQGTWQKRPDLVFAGIYVPVWLEDEGLWRWRMRGAPVYPTAEQSQHPPISIPRFDTLRLQGASVSAALAGAGAPADLVAQHAAGESAARQVIAAGRFDLAAGVPFDASKRIEMAHRAGLSDADTQSLLQLRATPGVAQAAPSLFAVVPKQASAAAIQNAKSSGLTKKAPPVAVRSMATTATPHPVAVLASGALCGVAGYFLAPTEYRLPAAAGAAVAGLLLTRFVH